MTMLKNALLSSRMRARSGALKSAPGTAAVGADAAEPGDAPFGG
jgi:hypothetical protein